MENKVTADYLDEEGCLHCGICGKRKQMKVIDYRLSVVERDARQQGMEAMKLLMECFADSKNRQRGKRILVPYRVILRGSEKSTKEMCM